MNHKWSVTIAVAILSGAVAFVVARSARCPRPEPAGLDRLQDISFLAKELGLSREQAVAIQKLHVTLAEKLNNCCQQYCTARGDLGLVLGSDTNSRERADALLAEMVRPYEASERATLDNIRQVRGVLTPEQRERFDQMISECMCNKCDMHGEQHSRQEKP